MKKILSLIAIANLLFVVGCTPNKNKTPIQTPKPVIETNPPIAIKDNNSKREILLQKITKLNANIKIQASKISQMIDTLRDANNKSKGIKKDFETEVNKQGILTPKNSVLKEKFHQEFVVLETLIKNLLNQISTVQNKNTNQKAEASKIMLQIFAYDNTSQSQFSGWNSILAGWESIITTLNQKVIRLNDSLNNLNTLLPKLEAKNIKLIEFVNDLKYNNINDKADLNNILPNFEGNNTNEMINYSRRRKERLDILTTNASNRKEVINESNLNTWPYKRIIDRKYPNMEEIKRFQAWQDHLHRVSQNSAQAYHEFSQQVLNVNSPGFYKNSQDVIADFKDVHLRDGVYAQLELEKVFQLSGSQSQNIVNMYNYFAKFYGKENAKRWIFDLAVKDRFTSTSSRTLAFVQSNYSEGFQHMKLGPQAFDAKTIKSNYDSGHFTSNNITSTFIHEYAHVLDNALNLAPNSWNMNYLPTKNSKMFELDTWLSNNPNPNEKAIEKGYKSFNSQDKIIEARNEFFYFIGQKIGYQRKDIEFSYIRNFDIYSLKDNQAARNTFVFANMFADGVYARSQPGELFAEIFAYWLLKPVMQPDRSKYSIRWTTINEFFLDYLPTRYNQAISNSKS